jgi:hypothetical protein
MKWFWKVSISTSGKNKTQKNHLYLVFSMCSHEYVEGWLKICTSHLVYVYIARIG